MHHLGTKNVPTKCGANLSVQAVGTFLRIGENMAAASQDQSGDDISHQNVSSGHHEYIKTNVMVQLVIHPNAFETL